MTRWIPSLAACLLAFSPALAAQQPLPHAASRASVLDEDIRDIKGPVAIPASRSPMPWMPLAAGALALGAAGFAFRVVRRGRKQSAIDAARASFADLRSAVADGRGREIAYRVSETVRQFIERRLRLPASRETTEQFLRRLGDGSPASAGAGMEKRLAFAAFLQGCDLAKFSGWRLEPDQMTALVESGSTLVETIEKEQGP
jgi:hypothetical protein